MCLTALAMALLGKLLLALSSNASPAEQASAELGASRPPSGGPEPVFIVRSPVSESLVATNAVSLKLRGLNPFNPYQTTVVNPTNNPYGEDPIRFFPQFKALTFLKEGDRAVVSLPKILPFHTLVEDGMKTLSTNSNKVFSLSRFQPLNPYQTTVVNPTNNPYGDEPLLLLLPAIASKIAYHSPGIILLPTELPSSLPLQLTQTNSTHQGIVRMFLNPYQTTIINPTNNPYGEDDLLLLRKITAPKFSYLTPQTMGVFQVEEAVKRIGIPAALD